MKMNTKAWFFLLGLGSATRIAVGGCISFSEIAVFVLAPFWFFQDVKTIKQDGFMTVIGLLVLMTIGMLIPSLMDHCPYIFIVKAIAVNYALMSFIVVYHRLLRNDASQLKWYFIGAFISAIITVFVLNPRVAVGASGSVTLDTLNLDQTMSGALFWVEKVTTFLQLPIKAFYLQTPLFAALIVPVIVMIVTAKTSGSGRSASLVVLLGSFLIALGRKRRSTMRLMGKYFILVAIAGLLLVIAFKQGYYYLAEHGYLSEGAVSKFEKQTKSGKGLMSLIVNGRLEPFVGLTAAIDNPILGYGCLPFDRNDYYLKALQKYGSDEDVQKYVYLRNREPGRMILIQTHSHIIGNWVTSGIFGLAFWVYVLWMMYVFIRKYASVIPQFYGYFAVSVPVFAWHIFFSPMGNLRQETAMFVALLLFVRAVGKKKLFLPVKMEMEAMRYA